MLKRRTDAGIVAKPTDEHDLLAKAEASIKSAREAQEREDFALGLGRSPPRQPAAANPHVRSLGQRVRHAYRCRGRFVFQACRPLAKAPIPVLIKPVCCAPCVAFNTLPELYFWVDWITANRATSSVPIASPAAASTTPRP